jgi:membrane-bound metal-dependent hydrolase YbcI (DUF457 family)
MFIGHFAVAFGAKRLAPQASLGTLFMGAQLADLIWPSLVLLGIERFEIRPGITAVTPLDFIHYPWSHSLASLCVWAGLLASAYLYLRPGRNREALALAALVLSHWVLDALSHRPDMPLTLEGTTRIGLGLWDSLAATLVVEAAMFAAGVFVYWKSTRPTDRTGVIALWSLTGFLCLIYLANLFGPPPPSASAVAWSAQAIWLLVAWGWWVDRHRITNVTTGARARA